MASITTIIDSAFWLALSLVIAAVVMAVPMSIFLLAVHLWASSLRSRSAPASRKLRRVPIAHEDVADPSMPPKGWPAPGEGLPVPSLEEHEDRDALATDSDAEGEQEASDPTAAQPPLVQRGSRQVEVAALGTPTDKPLTDGHAEAEFLRERARAIDWDPADAVPPVVSRDDLSADQWSLLEAIYELRLLTLGQIEREFFPTAGLRQVRHQLSRLREMGIVERGWIYCVKRTGRGRPIYVLAKNGFQLLRDAADHPASGNWRRPVLRSAQHMAHDIARNEWLFAFRSLAPQQLLHFRGPQSGRIKVPRVWSSRTGERPLTLRDLGVRAPIDLASTAFSNIVPDLTLELRDPRSEEDGASSDLLVEIEWANNRKTVRGKALAYDALLSGWWQEHPRYKQLGRPPRVCFAVPDLSRARRYLEILDEALQGYWVIPPHTQTRAENEAGIVPEAKKVYDGRRNVFVAVARDVHQRTLRAWQVPEKPPEEGVREAGDADQKRDAAKVTARRVQLLDPRDLVDPATEVGLPLPGA